MSLAVASAESCGRGSRALPQGKADDPADPLDIKDYAESTMKELLSWYGYEKGDAASSPTSSPTPRGGHPSDDSPAPSPTSSPHTDDATADPSLCGWCGQGGVRAQFTLAAPSGRTRAFCSEPCFSACRRAAFKRARACSWCRHSRQAVSEYRVGGEGARLHFCGDKCLNQYKMQIFCRETQAYLRSNPHLVQQQQQHREQHDGKVEAKLITPELWLRDCDTDSATATNGRDPSAATTNGLESPAETTHAARDVEDLTTTKSGHSTPSPEAPPPEPSHSVPYLKEEKERRKRHHDVEREHRKRHRTSTSSRHHRSNAPPAHLSSTPLYQDTSRAMRSSLIPPAAHSKTPAMSSPLLPPPPPLLNNDFHHPPFFQHAMSPQQQMNALRMQHPLPRHPFPPEPMLRHRNPPPFAQPNTVMLPYPIFVPLPVPIPIPLPLTAFVKKEPPVTGHPNSDSDEDQVQVDSDSEDVKSNEPSDLSFPVKRESYVVTNNDSQSNKLVISRNKAHQ